MKHSRTHGLCYGTGPVSEMQFEGKLDGTRPAHLVKRAKSSAAHIPGAQVLAQQLGGETETSSAKLSVWLTKAGMVEQVEHFRAKLENYRVMYWNFAMHGTIPLNRAESSERIAPYITLTSRISITLYWRILECRRIDCLSTGVLTAVEVQGLIGNSVGPDVGANSVAELKEICVHDLHRWSSACLNHIVDRPAM